MNKVCFNLTAVLHSAWTESASKSPLYLCCLVDIYYVEQMNVLNIQKYIVS